MAEIASTSPAAMDLTDEDKQEPNTTETAVTQAAETVVASETTAATASIAVTTTTTVTDEQWRAMKKIIEVLYAHRESE
jgi:thioredoxin-like negative regulator of GroEL